MSILPFRREQLPQYLRDNVFEGRSDIKMIEVGVYEGAYSSICLEAFPSAEIYLVDNWDSSDTDFYYSRYSADDFCSVDSAYGRARKRFEGRENVHFMRTKSDAAVEEFEDGSVDWAYIDGDHSYDAALRDISLYYKKIKPGGILSGHDWEVDPTLPEAHLFGIQQALTDFMADKLSTVDFTNEMFHKSWIVRK